MRLIFSMLLISYGVLLFGQSEIDHKEHKDLAISAKLYPSISKNTSYYGFNEFIHNIWFSALLSSGIELKKSINSKWSFQIGLQRSVWGFNEIGVTEPNQINNTYEEKYIYLTFPLVFIRNYKYFYYGFGVNTSYFLRQNQIKNGISKDFFQPNKNLDQQKIDHYLFGLNTKVGIEIPLNEKFNFQTEMQAMFGQKGPRSRYNQLWNNEGFKSLGLGFGISYKLGAFS